MNQIQAAQPRNAGCHSHTVFVVDDNTLLRKMVCNILTGKGLRVVAADSALPGTAGTVYFGLSG